MIGGINKKMTWQKVSGGSVTDRGVVSGGGETAFRRQGGGG